MANNYNVLADFLVAKYIDRISGNDISGTFVDISPAERVMVGMLSENRVDESFNGGYVENSNTRFESVPSISISFVVKKNSDSIIQIKPKGLLFYTVKPDYEKTVAYILQRYMEKDHRHYNSIDELSNYYPEDRIRLPLTYKKIRIEDEIQSGISIQLKKLQSGSFHFEHAIREQLSNLFEKVSAEIKIVSCDRISLFDLLSKERFQTIVGVKDEPVYPSWSIDIYCTVKDCGDSFHLTCQMVNKTPTVDGKRMLGYLPKIFNAGIDVIGNADTTFIPIQLDYFLSTYKVKQPIYAVAENTSVEYDSEENTIRTNNIPKYYQKRLKTKDAYSEFITFDALINDPISNLSKIHTAMLQDYEKCALEYRSVSFQSEIARTRFKEALEDYKMEIDRFKAGIDQVEWKDYVKKAFIYMNKSFAQKIESDKRPIKGWRLFQIVFIVSLICEMIRSEYKEDSSLSKADLELANLLYFPTGGGKTEAFLGACVFNMFFDRLRGKNEGITAILKYPLRLLAVQQLDRVLTIVMKSNIVRSESPELHHSNPFSVGFFVGKSNTPNKMDVREVLSDRGDKNKGRDLIVESDQDTLNEYYRFIDTCPCCGQKSINIRFNRETWTLEHYCDNPDCSTGVLPLYIVDQEIYRYLPSIVVSTVDKMAMLGTTNEFKMLLGQVKKKCVVHGFSCTSKCLCSSCSNSSVRVVDELKDPIPTLFIQDELHLVKESLGTFDAHYESFLNYYAKELVPVTQRKAIRFIGATATISRYKDHIRELYHMDGRRFPCEYPSMKDGEDFYSYTDNNDTTRIILGYAPYGRSITDGMWESVYVMRLIVIQIMEAMEESYKEICKYGFESSQSMFKEMLFDYWIELVYNNRKQDALELENAFQNQANNYLESKGAPKFVIEQMTSDVDFQTVRKTLFNIQANRRNVESTNLILATSTISHGVDEDSFNLMFFFGMPNNNAEYVQAYSRTGRKHTGVVIDIIRLMRIRDRSYLKNFVAFHQNKDELIESVPINRWAKNAIYSTLPGLLAGLLMQYYTVKTSTDSFYQAVKVKKLLMDKAIDINEVTAQLIGIYGCNLHEKMSIPYQEKITEEVSNILSGIMNGNFTTSDFLSDAIGKFSYGKKKPMTSLRDTEEQIEISIR